MITMKNFCVTVPHRRDAFLGHTGEHLSRRLEIAVDAVGPWAYKLDLRNAAGEANILDLAAEGNLLRADLERAALRVSGPVAAQIRAIDGERVKRSNVFMLFAAESVEAVEYFESLAPSEFEQLEARMTAILQEAEAAAAHPPVLSGETTWLVWDPALGAYADSGVYAGGEMPTINEAGNWTIAGKDSGVPATGPQGEKGETGTGFAVLDRYATAAELAAAVSAPEPGAAYAVGSAAPYDIYIFTESGGWVNHGPLQGAQGEKGEKGDKGDKGEKGDPLTYEDLTAEQRAALQGEQGETGAPGADGYTPVKGVDYWTAAEKQEMVGETVEALGDVAPAEHAHTADEITVAAATDYTTVRVRGICLTQGSAAAVPNGCLCGVYTVS